MNTSSSHLSTFLSAYFTGNVSIHHYLFLYLVKILSTVSKTATICIQLFILLCNIRQNVFFCLTIVFLPLSFFASSSVSSWIFLKITVKAAEIERGVSRDCSMVHVARYKQSSWKLERKQIGYETGSVGRQHEKLVKKTKIELFCLRNKVGKSWGFKD